MKDENIDKIFSQKIEEVEKLPDNIKWNKEEGWKNYKKVNNVKVRSRNTYKYIAAAMIVSLIVSTILFYSDQDFGIDDSAYKHYNNYISSITPGSSCELQNNTLVCSSNDGEKCKTDITMGLKQGDSRCLDENGEEISTGSWEAGTRHGEWLTYNVKGEVIDKKNYRWGMEIIN